MIATTHYFLYKGVGSYCIKIVQLVYVYRDTSGQGRFCTIFRSYSRGAQVNLSAYLSAIAYYLVCVCVLFVSQSEVLYHTVHQCTICCYLAP